MRQSLTVVMVIAANLIGRGADSRAADPATAGASDPWQYTLFNPTPAGQLRDMDTDRPNKTNTPHTIDAGHLQIETGFFDYAYDRDRYQGADARIDAITVGQFNFRLGVLSGLELNVVVNSYDLLKTADHIARQTMRQGGFGDMVAGGKLNLWGDASSDDDWATALAIQPQLKFPTARQSLGNGHAEFFVGVPFLMNLPAGFHLGLQPTVSWERNFENTGDVTGWQNSVSVDRVFFGKLDVYFEYWSHVSREPHQEAQQTLDVGVTYPVGENLVFDMGLNFGLNKASSTLEWLTGLSVRFSGPGETWLSCSTERSMYDTILLTLDASPADRPMIDHIKALAKIMHSRVVLLHVATGTPAQFYGTDAAGEEVKKSQAYLNQVRAEFEAASIAATAELAYGEPVREIVKWVNDKGCDLVAMGTHGHRLLADLALGTTASRVQHSISVPVLLLRAK